MASNQVLSQDILNMTHFGGFRLRTGWEDIQPKLGAYKWDYIDKVLADCRAHGKKLGLGVAAGVASPNPETWSVGGAEKFTLAPDDISIEKQEPDMNIPFDPKFQALWFPFIDAMGARYDANPDLGYVVVSGLMQLMENRLVMTAGDLARMEDAAHRYGFASFSVAWQDAAQKTVTRFCAAFPTTQVMLTTATVAPNGIKDNDLLTKWAKPQFPGQFGTMTAGCHALLPPYPVPGELSTFPKGDQPISAAADTTRFYKVPPVPFPTDPKPIVDLYGNAAGKSDMYLETYMADVKKSVNFQAIIDGNKLLVANAAGQPA